MAVFTHLETDTGTNADISSATAIGTYTATADKLVMVDVSIDQVAGDGDYVMYVTRQINGAGSAYRILPETTMAAASGLTAISAQSGWITVRNGDVLTCYVDGLAGDTSTPDWSTRWFELAGVTAAAVADSVWEEAIADHTTSTTFGGKNQKVVPSETINDYKADVSALTNVTLTAAYDKAKDDVLTPLAVVDGIVDAIKAKTDNLPANTSTTLAAIQADLDNPDQYKADVSALATSAALATVDTNVDSVLADTNEIQAELADGGRTDLLIDSIVDATTATGVLLKDDAIEAIFNDVFVTGTYTFAQLMKIMASALAGELSGGGSATLTFKSVDGASDVIEATVDANGNRTAVTLTV